MTPGSKRPTLLFATTFGTLVLVSHAETPSPSSPVEVVYSTNSSDGRILKLDFATGTSSVVNTDTKVRKRLEGLAVRDDGSGVHLLVCDSKRGEVLFYPNATGAGQLITAEIPSPERVSLDLMGNAYVLGADDASPGQVWMIPRGGPHPGGYAGARMIDGTLPARLEEIRVVPGSAGPLRQGDLLVLASKPASLFRYPRIDCAPGDAACTGFGPRQLLLAQGAFPRNMKPAGFAFAPNLDVLVTGDQRTILRYRPSGQRVQPDFASGPSIGGSRIVVGVQAGRDYAFVVSGGGEGDDSANSVQRFVINEDGTGAPDVTVRGGVRNPEGVGMGSAISPPTPTGARVIVTPAPEVQVAFDDVEQAGLTSARILEFEDNRLARQGAYELDQSLRDFFPEGSPLRSQLPDVIIPAHVQAFRKGDPLAGAPTFLLAIVNSTAGFSGTVAVDHDERQQLGYQPSCTDADPALQPRMFHAHESASGEPPIGEAPVFNDVSSDCGVGRGGALSLWLTARDTREGQEVAHEKLLNLAQALDSCIEPATLAELRTAFEAASAAFDAYEETGDVAQQALVIAQLDAFIAVAEQNRAAFEACGDSGNVRGELIARALSARFTIASVLIVPTNQAPAFTSSASPSVAENTTAAATVTATDPEGDAIAYSISGGADAARFSIDPTTGALSFNVPPDFEAPADAGANNVYEVVVSASDGTNTPAQAIAVSVTNVDEAPVITSSSSASVAENTTAVLTVTATDPEGSAVAYSISGGADAALFSIDGTSGALRFNAPPNFEAPADAGANNVYDVVVSASDGTNAPAQAIAVSVTNVNEGPTFTSSATPSVPENSTAVVTVTTSDPDGPAISYSISGGADAALFSINATSGALRFLSAPNFEAPADAGANNVYDVAVTASDGSNAPAQAIAVTVTNVNEAPVFTGPATASVEEYLFGPTPIVAITVTATDPDGGAVSYSIGSGFDGALFSIDPTIGVVTFNAPPDFEAPRSNVYRFDVVASDGANAPTRLLTVTVTDINETAVWNGSADSSWANPQNWEGNKPPEPDGPVNFTQSASFPPSVNSPAFALGAVTLGGTFTGTVQLSQPLIVAGFLSIGGGTTFLTNGNALVVTGLISGGGTLTASGGTVTTGGGLTVATFNPGTSLLFNGSGIWSGPANFGNVTLMGGVTVMLGSAVSTGNLSVSGGGILRAFNALTVNGATTVGAGSTLDLLSNTTFHGPLSVGGTLRAISSPITIRFASGGLVSFGDGSSVTIAPPSGFVDLLATTPGSRWQLQLEPGTSQTLMRVRVQDSDVVGSVNAVATAGTIVNLGGNDRFPASTPGWENLPNLVPVFTSSPLASVQENALSVVTVAASDPDGDPIGYSISGGADAALFSIDATTGALRFVVAPNFEAPSDAGGDHVYDVMVSASDGTIAPAQAIAVTVTNVDEAPVFFGPSTVSVAEGAPANTVVLTAMAIDPEGSAVFYSTSGLDAAFFTLDSFTGQLRFKTPPDFETKSAYNVQLRASDGTSFTESFVTIIVTDLPPVFVSSSTVSVPENTPTSTVVMTALATDPAGGSITYSISGLDAAFFTLDSFTGQLRFKAPPDFETKAVYNLQVRAHAGASFAALSVTVFVTDVEGS